MYLVTVCIIIDEDLINNFFYRGLIRFLLHLNNILVMYFRKFDGFTIFKEIYGHLSTL